LILNIHIYFTLPIISALKDSRKKSLRNKIKHTLWSVYFSRSSSCQQSKVQK